MNEACINLKFKITLILLALTLVCGLVMTSCIRTEKKGTSDLQRLTTNAAVSSGKTYKNDVKTGNRKSNTTLDTTRLSETTGNTIENKLNTTYTSTQDNIDGNTRQNVPEGSTQNESDSSQSETTDGLRGLKQGEMLLTLNDNYGINIYSFLPDNSLMLTRFDRKPWGTYNIGGQILCSDSTIPSEDPILMTGGGSDWEYVLMAGETPDSMQFSGGNHENEVMTGFTILDSNGDILQLKTDEYIKQKDITIVEDTYLILYNDRSQRYGNVRRTYKVEPSSITLDTLFEFTRDIYLETSYVSMLPVTKEFGNHISFPDNGRSYTTPSTGDTLPQEDAPNYYGNLEALSAVIWGDQNPAIKFRVNIRDEKMVDNFNNKLKTFFWDVDEYGNKLYFSKYENGAPIKIKEGTVWENSARWTVNMKLFE